MIEHSRIKLSRDQLAQFLPSHEAIREFEKLFLQDTDYATFINNILEAAGLDTDGTYITRLGSNYLDSSISLYQDTTILDDALLELVTKVSISTSIAATSQTILADAISGTINITMPSPLDSFNSNRSFKFAIHKTDSSSFAVNILPNAGELIINESSQSLLYEGEILNLITDGINWYLGA